MLPDEITDLIDRLLPTIAKGSTKGSNYYFYRESGLTSDQWLAIEARLLQQNLATKPIKGTIVLTPDGQHLAANGSGSYKRFVKQRQKQEGDSMLTNRYTRWGVGISGLALLVSWLAYIKPDDSEDAVKKLRIAQVADSTRVRGLQKRVNELALTQDSLLKLLNRPKQPSTSTSNDSQNGPATQSARVSTGTGSSKN